MDTSFICHEEAAGKPQQPAARVRLAEIDDTIAAIRTQIAAADLDRQSNRRKIDPRWFHRAKTALRHLRRERGELLAHIASLPARKDALKDRLIAVLREDYDDDAWTRALDEAHRRLAEGT